MFKHILLPTGGSALSEAEIRQGIQFAKSIGARVTGFYAMPEFHIFTYRTEMLEDTRDEFAKDCKARAEKYAQCIDAHQAAGFGVSVMVELDGAMLLLERLSLARLIRHPAEPGAAKAGHAARPVRTVMQDDNAFLRR